jgi:uncharacterized repeat protein (TIGR03847 family)
MSPSYDFREPDLFTAGTVGPPGQRVFYLQAREGGVIVTLKVEKEQVGALADYLADFLEKLSAAPSPPPGARRDLALVEPLAEAWPVRSLGVGYDQTHDRIVIVAQELRPDEDDGEEDAEGEAASARFAVNRGQAAAFVERARGLVEAGRPACPICARPMNPDGHVCPRRNGARHD